jgi:flagellar L-ring protein precursor FlgH
MFRKTLVALGVAAAFVLAATVPVAAQKDARDPKDEKLPKNNAYDVLYPKYLQAARAMAKDDTASIRWMVNLGADRRAREVNDLVTIQVVENMVAEGAADTAMGKDGKGSAGISKLFGLETKVPDFIDPTSLFDANSSTEFKGSGTTNRRGSLTAMVTARVAEVLPNGDLVLEGVREIDINGDRQVVVLTGVARQADLSPENIVLSPRVGQLRIRYFGQGLIKDNLRPGWLVRVLNKLF